MLQDRTDYFILAFDSPSFSAAAAKVPMSPQGFTRAIRNLEHELGVPLFVQGDDGVRRPTPYAEEFYEYAKQLQVQKNLLTHAFNRIQNEGYFELRIIAAFGAMGLLGPDYVKSFGTAEKNVSVFVNEVPDSLCEMLIHDGLYDLAFTTIPASDDLVTKELYRSPVLYWVSRRDPLARNDSLTLEDIASKRIYMPGREFHCYTTLLDGFRKAQITQPDIVECPEIFWIFEHVLKGDGIGFSLPHLAKLKVFADNEEVVALPLEGFDWGFGISYLRSRTLKSHEQVFIDFAARKAKKLNRHATI